MRGRRSFPLWGKLCAVFLSISILILPCLASEVGTPFYVQAYGYAIRRGTSSVDVENANWNTSYHHSSDSTLFTHLSIAQSNGAQLLPYFGFTLESGADSSLMTMQDNYTYDLSFTLSSNQSQAAISLDSPDDDLFFFLTQENVEHMPAQTPLSSFASCKDYTLSRSYTISRDSNNNNVTFNIVFRTGSNVSAENFYYFSPLIGLVNPNSSVRYYDLTLNSGTGTYDLDGSVYQEKVLGQLTDLKNDVNSGFNQTHEDLQGVQGSIEAGQHQQHQDAEDLKNNLNSIDQSVIAGNQQAHEDSQALQNKLEQMQQQEKEEATNNGDSEEGQEAIKSALSIDDFKDSVSSLFSALSYTGTDSSWTFPDSGDIPFIGHLWSSQTIDFSYWISVLPFPLKSAVNFVFVFGCVFVIIYDIKSLIKIFNKGDDD